MRWLLIIVLAIAGCSRHHAAEPGMWLLDPQRLAKLQPDAIVARVAPRPTDIVADIGAGPGAFVPAWSRALTRGMLIATDVRPDYLAHIAPAHNVQTRVVAADTTGLLDASVDVIFLCEVDQLFVHRAATLTQLARALKAHGHIVLINQERARKPLDAALAQLGWRQLDAWQPCAGFFAVSLSPR